MAVSKRKSRFNRPTARWGVSRNQALDGGYRSSYELAIANALKEEGVEFEYELCTYKVKLPASRMYMSDTGGKVWKVVDYTPDFQFGTFPTGLVIVEAKGRFDAADRKKAVAFKEQYPGYTYAMVFESNNKLSRSSKTRYADWCESKEIPCRVGLITPQWLAELVALAASK